MSVVNGRRRNNQEDAQKSTIHDGVKFQKAQLLPPNIIFRGVLNNTPDFILLLRQYRNTLEANSFCNRSLTFVLSVAV